MIIKELQTILVCLLGEKSANVKSSLRHTDRQYTRPQIEGIFNSD